MDIDSETQKRIERQQTELELKFAMIDASAKLRLDELLAGKSEEYRRGFLDGRIFESECTQAILNA
jgi:hypothetical protein